MEKLFDFQIGQEVFDTFCFPDRKLTIKGVSEHGIMVNLDSGNQVIMYNIDGSRQYGTNKVPTLSPHPYTIVFDGFHGEVTPSQKISEELERYKKEEFLETHFEMATRIIYFHEETDLLESAFKGKEYGGIGGCYILAKEWTEEFQMKYKDANWGEDGLDWNDTLYKFISDKLLK